MDKMITVYSPEHIKYKRIIQRDPYRKEEDIRKIIANQLSDEEKKKRADFVIYNDDEHMLIPQVIQLDKLFRA
jgi:dephospho-CoA kinase